MFWIGGIFLLMFIHPYIIYPASLRLFAKVASGSAVAPPPYSVTLVFSAYNEEKSLGQKIANLREIKAAHPDVEIIAYCDLSSDRTLEMLEGASDTLRVIAAAKRTGKATGMARMASEAKGDILIFTDANVLLEVSAIDRVRAHFTDPKLGGLAGSLKYINDGDSATAYVGGLYWRHEEVIKQRESACGSIMGADGSIFALRRELYPPVPPHLLDDMIVSMSAPLAGKRLIFAEDVIAYERNATSSADEFRRKRRIACRAFNTHRYLWPKILKSFAAKDIYKYCSHKLLRWFGFPLLVLGSACVLIGISSVSAAAAAVLCLIPLAVFGLGYLNVSPFNRLVEIVIALLATFVGIIDSWRGKTYQTWIPAASRN